MPRKAASRGQHASNPAQALESHDLNSNSESDHESGAEDSPAYTDAVNLPAHRTKHLAELVYRFPSIDTSFRLVQRNDMSSTGSSLWLSSQVLSSYLLHTYARSQQSNGRTGRKRMLELGSGTGLLSLLMARLGWQVTATDIPPVLDSVLKANVEAGLYQLVNSGTAVADQIHVAELDWTTPPKQWHWNAEVGPSTAVQDLASNGCMDGIRFDLILTADTVYEPSLLRPLLSTLAHLHQRQGESKPTVLLALERRDPAHITEALRIAKDDFALPFKQIPAKRVRKIFDTLGDGGTWSRGDWEGVEIWKL